MDKYGPNTEAVEALIEKIKTITPEQVEAVLDATWETGWNAALDAARNAALDVAWTATWAAARNAALDAAYDAAREPVLDAILATFTKGIISDKNFAFLYNPWASVMEAQN